MIFRYKEQDFLSFVVVVEVICSCLQKSLHYTCTRGCEVV